MVSKNKREPSPNSFSKNLDDASSFTSFGGKKPEVVGTIKSNVDSSLSFLKNMKNTSNYVKDTNISLNREGDILPSMEETSSSLMLKNPNVNSNNNNINNNNNNFDKQIPGSEFLNSLRCISTEEINSSPYLILEELTGGDLLRNTKCKINAAGLTTGLRKAKDGVAFFGRPNKNVYYILKLI
jgi:hypothetical protein